MRRRPHALGVAFTLVALGRFVACCSLVITLVACGGSDDSGEATATTTTSRGQTARELFEDPQGSYAIDVGADWVAHHGTITAEVEVWVVADPIDGFTPNVNVLTQLTPVSGVKRYLDVSIDQAPSVMSDFELIDQDVVEEDGFELGVLEYTGSQGGSPLHFLATTTVQDGTAVVATFTAPADAFEELRVNVEPYLLSLRPA